VSICHLFRCCPHKLTSHRANGNFDLFDDDGQTNDRRANPSIAEASDFIVDIREYDVPYHVRVMIDLGRPSPEP
jgi:DNA polymerase elongation subunit (family B)